MWNVRGTSTAMPNWLAHGATYALRVYAMRADWDGLTHSNQNVTPHSAIVTFTLPSCNPPEIATTTTTTVALTCATGGTCVVGDTGPGGGIVFYVHSDADNLFTSTGSDCGSSCKYLEAATADQSTSITWCSDTTTLIGTATAIGEGMANTTTAAITCSTGAIRTAADYSNGGKSDWHLPSLDELNQLYDQRATVGGLTSNLYWSSSEFDLSRTWRRAFSDGSLAGGGFKTGSLRVRVVRAFG
jgi:hypothetical protein